MKLYTEIQINASPERVWRFLTDFASYPQSGVGRFSPSNPRWNPAASMILDAVSEDQERSKI